jgi:hypothetical protein
MTGADIIREFERREAEAGGPAEADAKVVAQEIAAAHGLTYEQVREVLVGHWCMRGAG